MNEYEEHHKHITYTTLVKANETTPEIIFEKARSPFTRYRSPRFITLRTRDNATHRGINEIV